MVRLAECTLPGENRKLRTCAVDSEDQYAVDSDKGIVAAVVAMVILKYDR